MSFSDDLGACMNNAGLPTPAELFGSVTEAVQELSEIKDALENAGVEISTTTFQQLALLVPTLGLSAGAAQLIARIAAAAGTFLVSAYVGALLTCTANVVFNLHLQDEFAAAPGGSAKDEIEVALNDIEQRNAPA
jgi:hypothetical protein